MQLPRHPETPAEFVGLMEEIWSDVCEPGPDGGIIVRNGSPLYDDWHNANKVAKAIGLQRTGGSKRNGSQGQTFRWPNGEGVYISLDGAEVSDRVNRFYTRK